MKGRIIYTPLFRITPEQAKEIRTADAERLAAYRSHGPMPEVTLTNVEKETPPMPLILTKAQAVAVQYAVYHLATVNAKLRARFHGDGPAMFLEAFQGRDGRVIVSKVEGWKTTESERYENVEAFETAYKLETLI